MAIERRSIDDREQWLQWRTQDVTASDVAAVLGLGREDSAYKRTPARVWAEKTGLISPEPQTEFLEYRLAQEAAVVQMLKFRRRHWDVRRADVYVRDPEFRLGASPDSVATDPEREGFGCVECKTTLRSVYDKEWRDLDGEPGDLCEAPIYYQLQALTQAMLCGAAWAAIAAIVYESAGTGTFKFCHVPRHPDTEQRIRDGVARFWATTDAGQVPLPLNYELDADVIAALYPEARIKDPPLDLSDDNRLPMLLTRRAKMKRLSDKLKHKCEGIDSEIKDKVGHHELALLPGWRISWKMQKRSEHIVPEWKGRVLRITETRKGQ